MTAPHGAPAGRGSARGGWPPRVRRIDGRQQAGRPADRGRGRVRPPRNQQRARHLRQAGPVRGWREPERVQRGHRSEALLRPACPRLRIRPLESLGRGEAQAGQHLRLVDVRSQGAWNTYPVPAPEGVDGGGIGYSREWIGYSFPGGADRSFVMRTKEAKAVHLQVFHFAGSLGHPVLTQDPVDDLHFVELTDRVIRVKKVTADEGGAPRAVDVGATEHGWPSFRWPPHSPQGNGAEDGIWRSQSEEPRDAGRLHLVPRTRSTIKGGRPCSGTRSNSTAGSFRAD